MTATISFTEADLFTALRGLLLQIVPAGTEVIRAQVNRVPPPRPSNYIVMTQVLRTRLSMNIDEVFDVIFTGSITDGVLTVTDIASWDIRVGAEVAGAGVVLGTTITGPLSETTYSISPAQTVPSSTLYAGYKTAIAATQFDIQLDIHGPASAQTAAIIATLFRDEYATQYFENSGIDAHPLYTSEPRQMPFINGEAQYEERWSLDLSFHVNQVVQVPQQFADQLDADFISVDAVFPPL